MYMKIDVYIYIYMYVCVYVCVYMYVLFISFQQELKKNIRSALAPGARLVAGT